MSTSDDDLIAGLRALKGRGAPDALLARVAADAALEAARRSRPVPSALLMARIARDARRVAAGRRRSGRLALGGLAAACLVGVVLGAVDPGGMVSGALPSGVAVEDLGGGYEFQYADLAQ
ncbi:hypothetical protein [Palleronia rufa]|uniref:hypothetical protein n=1 Tax=Palleronia rufa TaxID=1530186 RepID=UPI00056D6460|nr:hypothetical protein [Palleronia rufa]